MLEANTIMVLKTSFIFLFPLETSTSASRLYSIASGNTISYQASYGFWDPPTQAR